VAQDPVVLRLTTWPGIGPITASAYVAALDDAARFGRASQVASDLGLGPREYSSGEQPRRGRVWRSAHPYLQSLLVPAAWRVWRSKDARTASLRAWAQRIADRRGKTIATVALARRLARLVFAMWRDGVPYDAAHTSPTRTRGAASIAGDVAAHAYAVAVVTLEASAR
jgi:transposase